MQAASTRRLSVCPAVAEQFWFRFSCELFTDFENEYSGII